ncbi:MAG: futalosine hydrolase [Planctomycetota bacterium]|jgi:futalosine hydrolase
MTDILLLFPTALEANKILDCEFQARQWTTLPGLPNTPKAAICGFGLPVATALASFFINECRPRHVILMGIAGSFDLDRAPMGHVVQGSLATGVGIGAGQGQEHISALDLGFDPHAELDQKGPSLPLTVLDENMRAGEIVSVASASANPEEAKRVREAHPAALLEDMESYGVALATNLGGCSLSVVRGISNQVGIRDKSTWKILDALEALRLALPPLLSAAHRPRE